MAGPLTSAPRLETDHLILRGPQHSDLPELMRFLTTSPRMAALNEILSEEQAWYGFLIGVGQWHWHGFGFFTLEERGSGAPVGRVGLLKHHNRSQVDLAWHLFDGAEGKGYATQAAQCVRRWAYHAHGLAQLVSFIDKDNSPSQAVAKRLGATTDGTRARHDPQCEVWTHLTEPV